MVTKERLHQLIDVLPPDAVDTAARVLEALSGLVPNEPLYSSADAPLDDELETIDERASVAEAHADVAAGRVSIATDVYKRLGL
ncbi:MAG: hypothetical protein IT340_03510 [Chloroflexi bacterium]|nr:hypothetical protein [Chloroflexota bacterium]